MARGGFRPGAGRPKAEEVRKQRQLRAFDDEWIIIKEFAKIVKCNPERAEKILHIE